MALATAFTASDALSATLAIFAVSAISPKTGITPSASSPADVKSPLARLTGIAAKSAKVSSPGTKESAVKLTQQFHQENYDNQYKNIHLW